jgi:hypothetical protein
MYKEAFWVLLFVTVVTLVLQMSGYAMIETVIFLIVMDFISLWIYMETRRTSSGLNEVFLKKIDNLEKACTNISESIGAVSSVLNLEENVNKQKEDIDSMMESINEKNRALEDKLNSFGQNLLELIKENRNESTVETY